MNLARVEDFDPVHIYVRQMLLILDELANLKIEKGTRKKALRLTELLILEMDAIKVVTEDGDIRKDLTLVAAGCKEIQEKGFENPKAFEHGIKQIKTACNRIAAY